MIHPERGSRRITSIPPRTSLGVSRGGITIRISGGSLLGGAMRGPRKSTAGEQDRSQRSVGHVFKKPPRQEKARLETFYERSGEITLVEEVVENCNAKGGLGIILQFAGIGFTEASFLKSRHDKPDCPVFYIPICYNDIVARLFLATRRDIFESQIVPAQMDVNPFFQKELRLPQLNATHDPTSMTIVKKNGLIIVGYNPCTH